MSDETTTDRLAEIEGQAADYPPPEGWRWLQIGEVIRAGDRWVRLVDGQLFDAYPNGQCVRHRRFIRRIEPEPQPEPEPEPQPVQVREGRWKTRGGEVKYIKAGGSRRDNHYSWPWTDTLMCWQDNGFYHASKPSENDLVQYLGPIQPEPDRIITPDDVAAEALAEPRPVHLQAMIEAQTETIARLNSRINAPHAENVELETELEAAEAESAKRLQQVEELRSEVSYVQGLLGEEKRRFAELETLTSDLRAVNTAQEKAINSAGRDKADLQHRLDVVSSEWAVQAETIRGLQTQLEAVKAELAQVSRDRYLLQIELDAREQLPEAVSERWEESYNKGAAQAVETIAEWTAPFRTCGSQGLALAIMQNLPHIMRSLTGLTDED